MQPSAQVPLLKSLQQKQLAATAEFEKKHAVAANWLKEKGFSFNQLREHSTKLLAGATLSSALLLAAPQFAIPKGASTVIYKTRQDLLNQLQNLFKEKLSEATEVTIADNINKYYLLNVAFELDNNRLPVYFGRVGLEQHLVRFPTDTLDQHTNFQQAGLAPGRGAFGYFLTDLKNQTQATKEEEYYIVLQTFMIPNWNQDWTHLKDWYAFRKFLVINPQTGQAVVTVLGDSGPAVSTGKVFGASPETMAGLGFYPGQTSGNIIVLFLDDPGNTIPLGPVNIKVE